MAVEAMRSAWRDAPDATGLSDADLVAMNDALGVVRRLTDAVHAPVAARIAEESRLELGAESLSKQQGFRNASLLIASAIGSSTGDASRLIKVGEATASRMTFTGESAPARHPHVAEALGAGLIGAQAASRIITMLDRVVIASGIEWMLEGEQILAEKAPGLTLDQLGKLITRVEAWLDPDGVEPREDELRSRRGVTMFQRDGALHVHGVFDSVGGPPIKAFIEGNISAQFQARRADAELLGVDEDRRTVAQMQADALTALAEHALGCGQKDVPMNGARVVIRVSLEELESGTGSATIDGIDQPISIASARMLAAGGGVIPWVCGNEGEILDWGREKRLFTSVQKLALVERDGGCAMCGLPPGMTKAHHLRWWKRDAGPTDLANGVLLCETCHHRIHDNGWDIRVDGIGVAARVWFIPPPHVDPARVPRLGGRARYDLAV